MTPQRPLHIVHFCAVDFTVRQFIAPLALELQRHGHRVQCACTPGPHWEELAAMGVDMVPMEMARSANPLKAIRTVSALVAWLRRERPDVLHVHTPVASLVGRLAGWLAGVPVVVYTAHGFYFHEYMPPIKRAIHFALEYLFHFLHHSLWCVSREDAELARRVGLAHRDLLFFVANGVDAARFDPAAHPGARQAIRAEFGIPPDATVIALMGRLVREKGYFEFFDAARVLAPRHDFHVLVIGDTVTSEHDDAKAEILERARQSLPAERLHFAGLRSDIPELLAAADIFCLPSHREGMPVSILEAMMMGLPVVATNIRGCREEVRHGRTGVLVRRRSPRSLAAGLHHLLANPGRAAAMGRAGGLRARRFFDAQEILRHQICLYEYLQQRVLQRRRNVPPPPWWSVDES